ncbi:MAG: DUF6482 family protein [Halioglobus sp.]
MSITFTEFGQRQEKCQVIVLSLDQALYQVLVNVDGKETLLKEDGGRPFRCRSLQGVREALVAMPVASLVLRHQSAYDEMIGQPLRERDNTLEVKLSLDLDLPTAVH